MYNAKRQRKLFFLFRQKKNGFKGPGSMKETSKNKAPSPAHCSTLGAREFLVLLDFFGKPCPCTASRTFEFAWLSIYALSISCGPGVKGGFLRNTYVVSFACSRKHIPMALLHHRVFIQVGDLNNIAPRSLPT